MRVKDTEVYKAAFTNGITVRDFDPVQIYGSELTPEILDISITSRCNLECPYCYRSATSYGKDLSFGEFLETFLFHMNELSRPFQVALGGGEPSLHPEFCDMIEFLHHIEVVPNYTTNGTALLNDDIVTVTERYCGGVALTYHENNPGLFEKSFPVLTSLKIQRNVHIIAKHNRVGELKSFIERYRDSVDMIVILEFHNVGRAKQMSSETLQRSDLDELKELFSEYPDGKLAVGASLTHLLIEMAVEREYSFHEMAMLFWNSDSLMTGFIDENLVLKPSSFWTGSGVDLRKYSTFKEAYNSNLFKELRKKLKNLSKHCDYSTICNGGMHGDFCFRCKLRKEIEL
ncbi:MAG: hypothetical protein DRG33_06175 [Deltaproteobacteria bacterium]|nr:MAG: hypothetical protein DRG33_06175 [Deltaproteobacteria bacterium]